MFVLLLEFVLKIADCGGGALQSCCFIFSACLLEWRRATGAFLDSMWESLRDAAGLMNVWRGARWGIQTRGSFSAWGQLAPTFRPDGATWGCASSSPTPSELQAAPSSLDVLLKKKKKIMLWFKSATSPMFKVWGVALVPSATSPISFVLVVMWAGTAANWP